MKIGKRIAKRREEMQLTQAEVAKYFDYTPAAISQWERDKSEPSYDDLQKLARVLGATMAELLGEKTA